MSKLLTWLSVSFNWYTYCVYTTPPTVTCGGGLPCAVNWATPAAAATTATPSARRMENVIGWLPSWGMSVVGLHQTENEFPCVTRRRGVCNKPVTDAARRRRVRSVRAQRGGISRRLATGRSESAQVLGREKPIEDGGPRRHRAREFEQAGRALAELEERSVRGGEQR